MGWIILMFIILGGLALLELLEALTDYIRRKK